MRNTPKFKVGDYVIIPSSNESFTSNIYRGVFRIRAIDSTESPYIEAKIWLDKFRGWFREDQIVLDFKGVCNNIINELGEE